MNIFKRLFGKKKKQEPIKPRPSSFGVAPSRRSYNDDYVSPGDNYSPFLDPLNPLSPLSPLNPINLDSEAYSHHDDQPTYHGSVDNNDNYSAPDTSSYSAPDTSSYDTGSSSSYDTGSSSYDSGFDSGTGGATSDF